MIKVGFKAKPAFIIFECFKVSRLVALLAMRNDILMFLGAEGWSKYGKNVNLHSIITVNDCIR